MKPKTPQAHPTGGDWQFNCHRYPDGKLSGKPYVYASGCGDERGHICSVFVDGNAPQDVQAMQEANGHLIAAAADLLTAAQEINKLYLNYEAGSMGGNALAALRAAIEKATGKATP